MRAVSNDDDDKKNDAKAFWGKMGDALATLHVAHDRANQWFNDAYERRLAALKRGPADFPAYKEAILAFLSSGPKCKENVRSHIRKTVGRSKKLFEDAWIETPESLKVPRGKKPANLPIKPS